jgi:DNA polymerase-3 subunit alpha
MGITSSADLASRGPGARVLLFGQVAALKETSTKSGNRMAFVTLEDMDGTVEVTVFPEAFKAAGDLLRGREPILVRGRLDESDRGRVVLADDIRPLERALAENGGSDGAMTRGEPSALRIRVPAGADAEATLAAVREACAAFPGGVPVFLHVLLPAHEVVVRSRAVMVDPGPGLLARLEELLGPGAATVDHA